MQIISGKAPGTLFTRTALSQKIGQELALHGSIHKIRRMSGFAFILLRTNCDVFQCVYDPSVCQTPLSSLHEEDCCVMRVRVYAQPRARDGWELSLLEVRILSTAAALPGVVLHQKAMDASLETLLRLRPVTLRNPRERAVFRIQDALVRGMTEYLTNEQFVQIHSPKIVSESAEGGANVFHLPYFGKTATLAQSPQFYKQVMVGVFERVFEIGPVFRAERHDTARHLNEYTSVDVEMGYIDGIEDLMRLESAMLSSAFNAVSSLCRQEVELLGLTIPSANEIPCIRYEQAKDWIARSNAHLVTDAHDFSPEEEQLLGHLIHRETGSDFVFVTHYPSAKRPFYAMDDPQSPQYTLSFDLLLRGMEITTGGQRIHKYEKQVEKMCARGMHIQAFESYLSAHRTGLPPHGGFGLGLERLTARLCGFDNVRRASLFPRDTHRLTP